MKGKHLKKIYWNTKRIVSAVLSVTLLLGCISFSTLAWLTNDKDPVVNKFTGSSLEISLSPSEDQGGYLLIPGVTHNLGDNAPKVTVEAGSVECYLFIVLEEKGTKINGEDVPYFYPKNGFEQGYFNKAFTYDFDVTNKDTYVFENIYSSDYPLDKNFLDGASNNSNHVINRNIYCVKTKGEGDTWNYFVPANSQADQTFEMFNTLPVGSNVTKEMASPANFDENNTPPSVKVTAYSIQTLGFKSIENSSIDEAKLAWAAVEDAIKKGNTEDIVLTQ